ncbi:MAG TPA: S1 RNA-binding domain-containing protein [Candidatus Paceibacterota bacterium]
MRIDKELQDSEIMRNLITPDNTRDIQTDDIVEGNVVAIKDNCVYIDIAPFGTGIIFGREYLQAKELIKNLNIGDIIRGKIVERENEDGYIELSLKEARQALTWHEADRLMHSKTLIDLPIKEANKGGLILEWQGLQGFLPSSQLRADHYPRVDDGNKEEIFKELKKLVGQTISVAIIGINPKEGKLIFSEKGGEVSQKKEMITKYAPGDEIEGVVTGAVDFGVFVQIEEGLEGLVHISELDWGLVEDPRKMFRAGDKIKAKVIGVSDEKISLSIKALKQNPWKAAADKYKKGDVVEGVVIKYNKHGALVAIEEGVSGLIHVSEFASEAELKQKLELGKSYSFSITLFEPKDQRMTLVIKQ